MWHPGTLHGGCIDAVAGESEENNDALVVLTDGDIKFLPKLQQHLKDNRSPAVKVSVCQLLWGKETGY